MSGPLRLALAAMVATVAAAMSLSAVFATNGWAVPVVGAVVLIAGSCALMRWSPLPSLAPIVSAVVVLLWVTWLFARPVATFGVIPNGAALSRLRSLAQSGFTDIHKLPPPVPAHHGLVLITVLGVTAVALVVDLLAVTLRRSALAGVPLLALFTVCAATSKHGVSSFAFAAAAVGFLVLLFTDSRERVGRWGAAMGGTGDARPAPTRSAEHELRSAPGSLGRRVGAAAIGISVVVPLVIPGLHAGFRGHGGGGGGAGGGGGSVTTIDPIVSVEHDLASSLNAPVMTFRSTSATPGYLRLTSLDDLNNETFSAAPLNAPVKARVTNGLGVAAPSEDQVTTAVSVAKNVAFRWLPMPTTAVSVTVSGDWRYDPTTATTFSASDTTEGLSYSVISAPNLPTPAQLAHTSSTIVGGPSADLIHSHIDASVRTLTQQITAGAQSKYDEALDIQRYLTSSHFTYTLTPPATPSGQDPLAYFLLHGRAGFCQQYSTAMAVMARLVGIPSRVAVGFTAGTRDPDGTWLVTTHDAHAWPELYFPNYGWLPFEPTPRGDGQAITPIYARGLPNQHGGPTTPTNHGSAGSSPTKSPTLPKHNLDGTTGGVGGQSASKSHGASLGSTLRLLALIVVIVLVLFPATARQLTRRRRLLLLHGAHPSAAIAWAELRDSALDAGAGWADGTSPRQAAAALLSWLGPDLDVAEPLARLTHAEELARYAERTEAAPVSLPADLHAVRAALRQRRSHRQMMRTWLLPPSTMARIRRA